MACWYSIHDVLVARKRTHQHHQRALGRWKLVIRQSTTRNSKPGVMKMLVSPEIWPVRAQDSSVRTLVVPTAMMRPRRWRQRSRRGQGFEGNVVPLAVHLVLGQVLGLHRLEGAGAHVQRHGGGLHPFVFSAASTLSSKCSAAVGAATAPGWLANTVW